MTLFCRCVEKRQVRVDGELDDKNLSFASVCKYLRKVGLKVSEVKMKLGINKIVHFLEDLSAKAIYQQKRSFINSVQKQGGRHWADLQLQEDRGNKENEDAEQPQSFIRIETAKSFISQSQYLQQRQEGKKQSFARLTGSELSKAFNVKQVVTKNFLDQPLNFHHHHVRFQTPIQSSGGSTINQKIIEQLQYENQHLQKCLRNIFHFFEERNILSCGKSVEQIEKEEYNSLVHELACKFMNYQQQAQQKIANLSAESSQLQQTLHNMSISLKIEKNNQKKDLSKHTQTQPQTGNQEALQSLRKDLSEASKNLQQKQMLLYIKDEEIMSLKVIISDLQNRLKAYGEKIQSKSYKKFFQITGQNLRKTVR